MNVSEFTLSRICCIYQVSEPLGITDFIRREFLGKVCLEGDGCARRGSDVGLYILGQEDPVDGRRFFGYVAITTEFL